MTTPLPLLKEDFKNLNNQDQHWEIIKEITKTQTMLTIELQQLKLELATISLNTANMSCEVADGVGESNEIIKNITSKFERTLEEIDMCKNFALEYFNKYKSIAEQKLIKLKSIMKVNFIALMGIILGLILWKILTYNK